MDVVGLDLSAPLLETAAERTAAAQARGDLAGRVTYLEADMRDPARALRDAGQGEGFDALVCFWSSFGYFGEADNRRHARAMVRALRPGGRALIDTYTAECLFPVWRATGVFPTSGDAGGRTALERRTYDWRTGVITIGWTFVDPSGGPARHAETRIRLYSAPELVGLLRESGFRDVQLYDGLTRAPFGVGASRCAVVATR